MFREKKETEKKSFTEKVKAKFDRAEKAFLISTVLMTLIFTASSVVNMMSSWGGKAIQYVIIALLLAYVIAFVALIVLFKKDKGELKENMQNYKFAIKTMKKVVNIINLALALSIMVESITIDKGPQQIFSFVAALLGIGMAIFKFILFVFKFARKKKKAKLKAAKKAERQAAMTAKTNKIKAMLGMEQLKDEAAADIESQENTENI